MILSCCINLYKKILKGGHRPPLLDPPLCKNYIHKHIKLVQLALSETSVGVLMSMSQNSDKCISSHSFPNSQAGDFTIVLPANISC